MLNLNILRGKLSPVLIGCFKW